MMLLGKINALLDKVGCMVIGDFQKSFFVKKLHMRPYMVTKRRSVSNKTFPLGHFMLHFTTFHNVSKYMK